MYIMQFFCIHVHVHVGLQFRHMYISVRNSSNWVKLVKAEICEREGFEVGSVGYNVGFGFTQG